MERSPQTPIYLDANALILKLNGKLATKTSDFIGLALEQERVYMSVVAVAEVRTGILSAELLQAYKIFLSFIFIDDFSSELIEEVARIRSGYRLKIPDAIIAATALARGGQLMTADTAFARVPGLDIISPALQ